MHSFNLQHVLQYMFCVVISVVFSTQIVWAVDPVVLKAEQERIENVAKISKATVCVFGSEGGGGGSGVLISADGYALSNFHVTEATGTFMKCGLNDGRLYDTVIVGIDPTGDVALIKLLGRDDFPFAPLGDSDLVQLGDEVYTVGNPFLLAADYNPSVSLGIVSGTHRYQYPAGTFLEYTDCIQVDAAINPGNSGGPLFNTKGEVVGINGRASFEKRGRVNTGAGYAISINQIKMFLDHLKSGRIVDHATMGATLTSDDEGTLYVDQILEMESVYRRGLRSGDEVVSVNSRTLTSVNQFKNVLGIFPAGWPVPLTYRQEGEQREMLVRLPALHSMRELIDVAKPKKKGMHNLNAEAKKETGPAEYLHLYEAKEGYANYYFNKEQQKRVVSNYKRGVEKLNTKPNLSLKDVWVLTGTESEGAKYEFVLAPEAVGFRIGRGRFFQSLKSGEGVDEPAGSGGLLMAMQQLRLWITKQQEGFTAAIYWGSEPLDGIGPKVDVLITTLENMETRWLIDSNSGQLLGLDSRRVEDVEACELRLKKFRSFEGIPFPEQIQVSYAGNQLLTMKCDHLDVKQVVESSEKKPMKEEGSSK